MDSQLSLLGDSSVARPVGLPVARSVDVWGRPETDLFVRHLRHGALPAALDVLGDLPVEAARSVLCEAGFVPRSAGGRTAMLESVQHELIRAAQLKLDGHALRRMDGMEPVVEAGSVAQSEFPSSLVPRDFDAALKAVQAVFSSPHVEVGVAGSEALDRRASLLFIGAQALEHGVSGLGIEGVQGRFQLPDSVDLEGLQALYFGAAGVVAESAVRKTLPGWAAGRSAVRVSDFVPEDVAAVLRGPVSLAGAEAVSKTLADGSLREFAGQHGLRMAAQVLRAQGVDLMAKPLEKQVADEGLAVIEAKPRGTYAGPVMARDHRGFAIRSSAVNAMIVSLRDLPMGMELPKVGDRVVVKASADRSLSVKVEERKIGIGR